MNEDGESTLSYANKYLEQGFSFIPIEFGGKKPDLDSWKEYQERQTTKIEADRWLNNGKRHNIGIVCGKVSRNLVVMDFDSAEKLPFLFDFEKLRSETRVVRTARGFHVYFRLNSGPVNSSKFPNLGIDLQAEGKYVVAPPSTHPTGILYEDVGQDSVVELEDVELLEYTKEMDGAYPIAKVVEKYWRQGNRHETALRLASFLKQRADWKQEKVYHLIQGLMRLCADNDEIADRERAIEDAFRKDYPYDGLPNDLIEELEALGISDFIQVSVSEKDGISGIIKNGSEGVIQRRQPATKQNVTGISTLIRFNGEIGPMVQIDDDTLGLEYKILGEKGVMTLDEFMTFIKHRYSLTADLSRYLREILEAWATHDLKKGQIKRHYSSPISVVNDTITLIRDSKNELAPILRNLRDYYEFASHPIAYISTLGWSLLAPLHYELKARSKKGIQTPWMVEDGKTKGGKTALGTTLIGKGYAQDKDRFFLTYEMTRTPFMLKKHLAQDNLPRLFDDVPIEWLFKAKESLKSYVQTGIFGELGRPDQTSNTYRGRASGFITINDERRVDDDLALSLRLHIDHYTDKNTARKDKTRYDQLFDSLPEGFMLDVFESTLAGKPIQEILSVVEKFETEEEWINYGIDLINSRCEEFNIAPFPKYRAADVIRDNLDNATEIIQAFLGEWGRIKGSEQEFEESDGDGGSRTVTKVKYRSKIEGEFKVEWRADKKGEKVSYRNFIYFTPSAFKTLIMTQGLRAPFSNATNFLNNILSSDEGVRVENMGKPINKKIGNLPLRTYCVSIPVSEEKI